MRIDWDKTRGVNADLADGMAELAELDLGLPFALVIEALDRAEGRQLICGHEPLTRWGFLAELQKLVDQATSEVIENA